MARRLFREYRQWHLDHREVTAVDDAVLALGLGYLDAEIDALPWEYAPPRGALVLALEGSSAVGCGELRPLSGNVGEIKRVYVRDAFRGRGLGARITRTLLSHARRRGYERVVLDTMPGMAAAVRIYRRLGFVPTDAYWANPVPGALFFEYRFPPRPPRRSAGPVPSPAGRP
jgi:putative acetyltransferase